MLISCKEFHVFVLLFFLLFHLPGFSPPSFKKVFSLVVSISVFLSCQELDGVCVFGVVEGGDILEERLRSARETAKRPVAGFCLDGFQTGAMDQALRTQLITAVMKDLPEDKPRLGLCQITDTSFLYLLEI